jgi:hypothetical protein
MAMATGVPALTRTSSGVLLVCILAMAAVSATTTARVVELPPMLSSYVAKYVSLSPAERAQLLNGGPTIKLLAGDQRQEVSLFGAIWIDAPPSDYVRLIQDIEQFERGGPIRHTKKISNPPRPADFEAFTLPDHDLDALRTCRVGDCDVKLSEDALLTLQRRIDWTKPTAGAEAAAAMRQIVYEYVKGYMEGGNDRLAVYRDAARPTFVAAEFASMIERMPELGEYLPDLKAYLLHYPRASLPTATSFLYWQEVHFGLKPTHRINHVVIDDRPGMIAVASKLIYATHYFWTALDLRVLVPDPARGRGFWLATVTRSRSDGLDGFTGRLIRGQAQSHARRMLDNVLRSTKARLEASPTAGR